MHLAAQARRWSKRCACGRYKETATEHWDQFQHRKCFPLNTHGHLPQTNTRMCTHTRLITLCHGSADVSEASFQMHRAPQCHAECPGCLFTSARGGKRSPHFLLFSTAGLGSPASILGKQEVWGQKRCSQVEQETAILGHANPCPPGRGQRGQSEPPLTCVQLLVGPGSQTLQGGSLARDIEPDRSMTPGSNESKQTALPLLREGQLALAKHSGTKYFNTHQRSKEKHSNYQNRNNSTE